MKVILLSNNENAANLADKLSVRCSVELYHEAITVEYIEQAAPDLVVSYNYSHIVKDDVINCLGDRIINLHTSLLPWNRGSSPNLWSFIEDTPKGVTIHRLEKGLDTGKIIFQKEVEFDEAVETLASSYQILQDTIVELLMDNWDKICIGDYVLKDQVGKGTYHRTSDLKKLLDGKHIDYSMTIEQFKEFIRQ